MLNHLKETQLPSGFVLSYCPTLWECFDPYGVEKLCLWKTLVYFCQRVENNSNNEKSKELRPTYIGFRHQSVGTSPAILKSSKPSSKLVMNVSVNEHNSIFITINLYDSFRRLSWSSDYISYNWQPWYRVLCTFFHIDVFGRISIYSGRQLPALKRVTEFRLKVDGSPLNTLFHNLLFSGVFTRPGTCPPAKLPVSKSNGNGVESVRDTYGDFWTPISPEGHTKFKAKVRISINEREWEGLQRNKKSQVE